MNIGGRDGTGANGGPVVMCSVCFCGETTSSAWSVCVRVAWVFTWRGGTTSAGSLCGVKWRHAYCVGEVTKWWSDVFQAFTAVPPCLEHSSDLFRGAVVPLRATMLRLDVRDRV